MWKMENRSSFPLLITVLELWKFLKSSINLVSRTHFCSFPHFVSLSFFFFFSKSKFFFLLILFLVVLMTLFLSFFALLTCLHTLKLFAFSLFCIIFRSDYLFCLCLKFVPVLNDYLNFSCSTLVRHLFSVSLVDTYSWLPTSLESKQNVEMS